MTVGMSWAQSEQLFLCLVDYAFFDVRSVFRRVGMGGGVVGLCLWSAAPLLGLAAPVAGSRLPSPPPTGGGLTVGMRLA